MKILKLTLNGIAWGCTVCTFVLMIGAMIAGDAFLPTSAGSFIKQSIASMIVGIGFVVPTLIYEKENLSRGIQTLIHMGIGFLIYFPIAFYMNWLPVDSGWLMVLLSILIAVAVSFIILSAYYLYYKKEAERINKRIENPNN